MFNKSYSLSFIVIVIVSTMYANNNICNFETTLRKNTFGFMQRLEQSTNSIISTLYQSWIVRFDIWNSWIKSLYVT